MGKEAFSKIKLLKIWEILKQDSDENNPLTTNQIIDKLAASGIRILPLLTLMDTR